MSIEAAERPVPSVGASHEQIVFSKINIRAPVLPADPRGLFVRLFNAIASLPLDTPQSYRFLDEQNKNDQWYISRLNVATSVPQLRESADIAAFTLRRESDSDDGQVVAIDRVGRWAATALPFWLKPREAADELEAFIRVLMSIGADESSDQILYEVDLICSSERILDWLAVHPQIVKLNLTTWRPNPSKLDYDEIIAQLDEVNARRLEQRYEAYPKAHLRVTQQTVQEIGEQTDNGNGRLVLEAGSPGGLIEVFDTDESPEQTPIAGILSTITDVAERTIAALASLLRRKAEV